MKDRLRHDLHTLADEVTMVDLRDRSIRTSRRLKHQRVLLSSAAAVVLLAGGAAIALADMKATVPQPPAVTTPATSMSASGSPSISATPPKPTDFAFPPPPSSAATLGPWRSAAAESLPGKAYFYDEVDQLAVLGDGQFRTSRLEGLSPASCIRNTLTISPDGTHVAWVRGTMDGPGQLVTTVLTTGRSSALADRASCGGGSGPNWRADSRAVKYWSEDGLGWRDVNLDTGAKADVPAWGEYRAVVPGHTAYRNLYQQASGIVVEDDQGSVVHTLQYDSGWHFGYNVLGLSYDGRYVGVSQRYTDIRNQRAAVRAVDVTTGKELPLPLPTGDTMKSFLFLPDGGVLIQSTRTNGRERMTLTNAGLNVTAQTDLPKGAGLLLRYVP